MRRREQADAALRVETADAEPMPSAVTTMQRRHGTMRWRILLAALLATLALMVSIALISLQAHRTSARLYDIHDQALPRLATLVVLQSRFEQVDGTLRAKPGKSLLALIDRADIEADAFREALHQAQQSFAGEGEAQAVQQSIAGTTPREGGGQTPMQRLEAIGLQFDRHYADAVVHLLSRQPDAAVASRGADALELSRSRISHSISGLLEERYRLMRERLEESELQHQQSVRRIQRAGITMALGVLVLGFWVTRAILRRLGVMIDTVRRISLEQGDLSNRIEIDGNDEMNDLAFWFNHFLERMQRRTAKSTEQIMRIAYTDNLTALANRRSLFERIDQRLASGSECADGFSILYLDLDNFKPINDQFGHEAGDEVIRQVATRLRDALDLEADETAQSQTPNQPTIARIGGDEFMILLPGRLSHQDLAAQAAALVACVSAPYEVMDVPCTLGLSIGISCWPDDAESRRELIEKADAAMYEAKRRGKNGYVFYSQMNAEETRRRNELEQVLRDALSNGQLALQYQPKFEIKTRRCVGAEALLRLHDPRFGELPPSTYLKFAEQNHLLHSIDEWVLNAAIRQLAEWRQHGYSVLPLSVNISVHGLMRNDFVTSLEHQLQLQGIDARLLEIEITESASLSEAEVVLENIGRLRELGIRVVMDDFGTGYAAMSLLLEHQVDMLKLDRSLLLGVESDSRRRLVVGSICRLASDLGVDTLAEGVETEQQREALLALDCNLAQGHLFARPMSADDLARQWLDQAGARNRIDAA